MRRLLSRPPARLALIAALVAAPGCTTGTRPPPETAEVSPSRAPAAARAPATVHDRTDLRVSARAVDGALWGVGWRDGEALFRWENEGWRPVESLAGLPGGVIALAADPGQADAVVSLWTGRPQSSGDRSLIHLYRHAPGRERVPLASFANPTADERGERGLTPSLAVDAGGDVWLSFPAPLLLRVRAAGGEPERIELPTDAFSGTPGRELSGYLPLRFTPDAGSAGEGWLWSVVGDGRSSRRGVLARPLRIAAGRVAPAPAPEGLPAEGGVACVFAGGAGRSLWAMEGGGLWELDLSGGRAKALPSPPESWRILDYARPAPGVEVALTVAQRRSAHRLVGEVWIRKGEGPWRSAGFSGDVQASTSAADGWMVRPRSWAVVDELLVGAGFSSGLVAADLREETPQARTLDWRAGLRAGAPRELFVLPDGRLFVQGSTATAAAASEWRAAWGRAVARGEEENPGVEMLPSSVVRFSDGRLWALHASGRGAPCVRHWDGGRWSRWPLPPERDWWPEEGFFVEAASGRVVVTGEGPKTPAWLRDETAEGGWRRVGTVLEWLAARADSGEDAAMSPRLRESYLRRPVFGPQGRVLMGWSGALWLRREGEWRMFATRELGSTPWRYGFDEAGEPWFSTQRERRRLLAAGGLGEPEPWRDAEERGTSSYASERPDWINAWFEGRRVDAVHPDERGVWWLLSDGELWAAREGEFARVFADDEPSPFRIARNGSFSSVLVDERGHRVFVGITPVLLPALPAREAEVEWQATEDVADRVAVVRGGGRAEWRLGEGPWRSSRQGRIELRELPPGEHRLEVRLEDRRMNPLPARALKLSVSYDEAERMGRLLAALGDEARRADAVWRIGRMGTRAAPRLRAELAAEQDETRAWWLRAALQAAEDAAKREGAAPNVAPAPGKTP